MRAPSREDQAVRAKGAHVWERDPLEWYVEPKGATTALARVESFCGTIWDPCCGGGNIIRALKAWGYSDVFGSDIQRRVSEDCDWFVGERDFLADDAQAPAGLNIVMNPPYFRAKGTEAFIRKALQVGTGKIAVFCDARFRYGARRASGLWSEHPPTRIWHITPRPSCPPGSWLAAGNEAGGGTADFDWLVWDREVPHTATVAGWLTRKFDEVAA